MDKAEQFHSTGKLIELSGEVLWGFITLVDLIGCISTDSGSTGTISKLFYDRNEWLVTPIPQIFQVKVILYDAGS